jgi:MoaA/NifB/PqqE/SkfB family radical SAM enzyme
MHSGVSAVRNLSSAPIKFGAPVKYSKVQEETLRNNFVHDGVIYDSIDVHTMLDCGPSRGGTISARTTLNDQIKISLANSIIVREEFFGATVFNIETHTIAYLDRRGADLVELVQGGMLFGKIKEFCGKAPVSKAINQLIDANVLTVNERKASTVIRFIPAIDLSECFLQVPFIVELEMTHGCYRTCSHCAYNSSPTIDRTREFSTEQWKIAIRKLVDAGVPSIRFTGGDFLFRRDAVEILEYTDALNVSYHFLSDTVAIADRYIDTVKNLKNLAYIGTSIDGQNAEQHEYLRGAGAFETLCERVNRLSSAGLRISLGTTLHRKNWRSVRETGRLANRLGATFFELGFLSPVGRGATMASDVLTGGEIRQALTLYLDGISAKEYAPMQSHYLARAEKPQPFSDIEDIVDTLPFRTEWPFSRLRVKPDGQTYTAGKLKSSILSRGTNILHAPLNTIWRTSPNLRYLREVGAGRRLHSLDTRTLEEGMAG